jgi:hypothetical protein
MASNDLSARDKSIDEVDELNEHVRDPGDPDGLVAADEHRHWQENDSSSVRPQTIYKPKRLWPRIVITLLILVVAAMGSYWFGNHEANKQVVRKSTTDQQSKVAQTVVTTKHYDSNNYTLGFDYPSNWVVSDNTTKLTVVSPATELVTATGAKTSAHVIVTIQNQQTSISGFPSGGATAALTSDHLTYTQPSTVQRAQTYVSYLTYGAVNELDALYITGDSGYQQGQQIPMSDIVQGDPLISVSFESCSNDSCADGKAVSLRASTWQTTASSKDVISLIESIVLQD